MHPLVTSSAWGVGLAGAGYLLAALVAEEHARRERQRQQRAIRDRVASLPQRQGATWGTLLRRYDYGGKKGRAARKHILEGLAADDRRRSACMQTEATGGQVDNSNETA